MVTPTLTIRDVWQSITNKSEKKNLDIIIMPFIILPVLLLIATISRTVNIIVIVVIGMGALYVHSRPQQRNRSPFFFSWTISSCVTMFLEFELGTIQLLEITQLENFIFLVLLACTCYFFYKMKIVADFELATGTSKGKEYSPVLTADSHYCQICQIEVNDRFFHSIWWDSCILRSNYKYFLAGQLFAFASLLYGTVLSLTTVCQPFTFYGDYILLPEDCDIVYEEFGMAFQFATCTYAIGYLFVIILVMIRQVLIYIPKFCEPQWRRIVNVLNV